ncbi:hypothetical protein FSP39_024960 [Pinctada imbricata]|uniref:Uncharacterized protein n=1 Tax=Pinctada imbricata TaxID=66713 RepID=A0AA88XUP0_PINIB|nr:hypothetical protein FSP39_024960 [Pinctada imbricata]
MVRHKEICRCNPNRIPSPTSNPVTTKKRKVEDKGKPEEEDGLKEPSYPKEADLPEILLGYSAPEIPQSTAGQQALFPDPPRQVVIREAGDVTGEDLLALAAAMSGIQENGEATDVTGHGESLETAAVSVGEDDQGQQDHCEGSNQCERGKPVAADAPQQGNAPTFIPLWDMRSLDRPGRRQRSIYEGLELDPRLFFLGAPSMYSMGQEAEALRGIHERARRLGDRSLRFLPPDFTSYHREESAVLPDGTVYRIGSTLTRRYPPLRTSSCQTKEGATCASSRRDVATQTVTNEEGTSTDTETQCEIIQARIY